MFRENQFFSEQTRDEQSRSREREIVRYTFRERGYIFNARGHIRDPSSVSRVDANRQNCQCGGSWSRNSRQQQPGMSRPPKYAKQHACSTYRRRLDSWPRDDHDSSIIQPVTECCCSYVTPMVSRVCPALADFTRVQWIPVIIELGCWPNYSLDEIVPMQNSAFLDCSLRRIPST